MTVLKAMKLKRFSVKRPRLCLVLSCPCFWPPNFSLPKATVRCPRDQEMWQSMQGKKQAFKAVDYKN